MMPMEEEYGGNYEDLEANSEAEDYTDSDSDEEADYLCIKPELDQKTKKIVMVKKVRALYCHCNKLRLKHYLLANETEFYVFLTNANNLSTANESKRLTSQTVNNYLGRCTKVLNAHPFGNMTVTELRNHNLEEVVALFHIQLTNQKKNRQNAVENNIRPAMTKFMEFFKFIESKNIPCLVSGCDCKGEEMPLYSKKLHYCPRCKCGCCMQNNAFKCHDENTCLGIRNCTTCHKPFPRCMFSKSLRWLRNNKHFSNTILICNLCKFSKQIITRKHTRAEPRLCGPSRYAVDKLEKKRVISYGSNHRVRNSILPSGIRCEETKYDAIVVKVCKSGNSIRTSYGSLNFEALIKPMEKTQPYVVGDFIKLNKTSDKWQIVLVESTPSGFTYTIRNYSNNDTIEETTIPHMKVLGHYIGRDEIKTFFEKRDEWKPNAAFCSKMKDLRLETMKTAVDSGVKLGFEYNLHEISKKIINDLEILKKLSLCLKEKQNNERKKVKSLLLSYGRGEKNEETTKYIKQYIAQQNSVSQKHIKIHNLNENITIQKEDIQVLNKWKRIIKKYVIDAAVRSYWHFKKKVYKIIKKEERKQLERAQRRIRKQIVAKRKKVRKAAVTKIQAYYRGYFVRAKKKEYEDSDEIIDEDDFL